MAGFSGLFNGVNNENYALLVDKSPLKGRIGRLFRRKGLRVFAQMLQEVTTSDTLDGESFSQIDSTVSPGDIVNGGARTINTVTTIANAAVTAAQVADAAKHVDYDRQPAYPTDKARNQSGVSGAHPLGV